MRNIILQNKNLIGLDSTFKDLVKQVKGISKYDLIQDYKLRIDDNRKFEIITELEKQSELKYRSGDYKGSIRAIRRSEKYYWN